MPIEILKCPHCLQDVEANIEHDYGVCFHCYREFPIKEALKQRKIGEILARTPAMIHMIGKSENEVERQMKECFEAYERTFNDENFDEGVRCAALLMGMAIKPEQKHETTLLIEAEGLRAISAYVDKAYTDIAACRDKYRDELERIKIHYENMQQEIKSKGLSIATAMVSSAVTSKATKTLGNMTAEITTKQHAEMAAFINEGTERALGCFIKLSNIICTAELIKRIENLGYDLLMDLEQRTAYEETCRQTYGRYKAADLICEEESREAWPELPAEAVEWRILRRKEDGAVLIEILRSISEKVRTITYTIQPLDENRAPLFARPAEWTQDRFSLSLDRSIHSTNEVCTLPALPDIVHARIRMKKITLANGTEYAVTENGKTPVEPPAPDAELIPALKAAGGYNARSIPYRDGVLWRCICGKYNPIIRDKCLCCERMQDAKANTMSRDELKDKARAVRVERENQLLKPYEYKGLTCRHFSAYYTYEAKEGRYQASEPLQTLIGEDLPACTAMDGRWFTYIDARSGRVKAIDLDEKTKLEPELPECRDMAYEGGLIWAVGEELISYSLKTGEKQILYPKRAKRPVIQKGAGYFLDVEKRLHASFIECAGSYILAEGVQAFTVDGDTVMMTTGDKLISAKLSTDKGLKLTKPQMLAKGVNTEKLAADESYIYYYLWALGGGSVCRISRKGSKPQTMHEGGVYSLFTDHGKVYAATYKNELLCLNGR